MEVEIYRQSNALSRAVGVGITIDLEKTMEKRSGSN